MTIQNKIGAYLQSGREWYNRDVSTIKVITVHHDAIPHDSRSATQIMQQIFNSHTGQGWPGMAYHYFIHRDGTVYQVNKHEWVTWHDGVNWDAIGICVTGYFHPDYNNQPTKEQLQSLKALLDELCKNHPEFPASQGNVYGHRERNSTACPGNNLYPYVKEYRETNGNVSWGESGGATVEVPAKDFESIVFKSTQHDKTSKNWGFDDPRSTTAEAIDEKIQKSINAYKGQVSQAQAGQAEAERKLAIAENEVKNREEQVSRLKEQLTKEQETSAGHVKALLEEREKHTKEVSDLRAELVAKQQETDAAYKQKGAALNELAGVKKELETCRAGASKPTKSLWEVIWEFLTKTKVQT